MNSRRLWSLGLVLFATIVALSQGCFSSNENSTQYNSVIVADGGSPIPPMTPPPPPTSSSLV
jgi:hypothetical protein